MRDFLRQRLVDPLLRLLRQGATPAGLALSVALAAVIGLVPVLGVSTLLCALAAVTLGLNLAAMQLVNYLLTPAQLVLIIPQLRLGEHLLGAERFPVTLESGAALLSAGVLPAIRTLGVAILHASLAWLLLAPPLAFLIYRALRPVFQRMDRTPTEVRP